MLQLNENISGASKTFLQHFCPFLSALILLHQQYNFVKRAEKQGSKQLFVLYIFTAKISPTVRIIYCSNCAKLNYFPLCIDGQLG